MSHTRRAPNQAGAQDYSAVPQSPTKASNRASGSRRHTQPVTRNVSVRSNRQSLPTARGAIAAGVATGAIGGGYGPYSYHPDNGRDAGVHNGTRFSTSPSEQSVVPQSEKPPVQTTSTVPQYLWDKDPDLDDALHNPDIRGRGDNSFTIFSWRGWANASMLVILVVGLITLFAGYPVFSYYTSQHPKVTGFNLGGINSTGQIPDLPGMPTLIDSQTPQSAYTRVGSDGKKYNLVFSDEFNTDGRTFYPGDDPYWEAVDLHYWPTGDLEWYSPDAITTENGKLVITLTEESFHDLNFKSGMMQSWNKLCFNTGYVEVSVSLPGSTFPNQTATNGAPTAAATGGDGGGPLSYLPGQRLSACTCPGSDHPGPSVSDGRGVPEIDILEAQVDTSVLQGQVSQSFQLAPYNYQYQFNNASPATTIVNSSITSLNTYKGGVFQQAVSAVSFVDSANYNDQGYAAYGYEWFFDQNNRQNGYITWYSGGAQTWTVTSASIGADPVSQVSARLIPEEPMYLILNLGMAPGFQKQDFKHLVFPSKMYVDYVRVYQRQGTKNGITCDPPNHPTTAYIANHLQAYSNPNLTTWAQAGNTFPRNSLYNGYSRRDASNSSFGDSRWKSNPTPITVPSNTILRSRMTVKPSGPSLGAMGKSRPGGNPTASRTLTSATPNAPRRRKVDHEIAGVPRTKGSSSGTQPWSNRSNYIDLVEEEDLGLPIHRREPQKSIDLLDDEDAPADQASLRKHDHKPPHLRVDHRVGHDDELDYVTSASEGSKSKSQFSVVKDGEATKALEEAIGLTSDPISDSSSPPRGFVREQVKKIDKNTPHLDLRKPPPKEPKRVMKSMKPKGRAEESNVRAEAKYSEPPYNVVKLTTAKSAEASIAGGSLARFVKGDPSMKGEVVCWFDEKNDKAYDAFIRWLKKWDVKCSSIRGKSAVDAMWQTQETMIEELARNTSLRSSPIPNQTAVPRSGPTKCDIEDEATPPPVEAISLNISTSSFRSATNKGSKDVLRRSGRRRPSPPFDPEEVILCYPQGVPGAVNIKNSDYRRLRPGEFLNDTLIEFGLKLWLAKLREVNPEVASQVHIFSSFFYHLLDNKIPDEGYESVRKWTAKIDIFKKKYIIVPINDDSEQHWYLAIIYQPEYIITPPKTESKSSTSKDVSESAFASGSSPLTSPPPSERSSSPLSRHVLTEPPSNIPSPMQTEDAEADPLNLREEQSVSEGLLLLDSSCATELEPTTSHALIMPATETAHDALNSMEVVSDQTLEELSSGMEVDAMSIVSSRSPSAAQDTDSVVHDVDMDAPRGINSAEARELDRVGVPDSESPILPANFYASGPTSRRMGKRKAISNQAAICKDDVSASTSMSELSNGSDANPTVPLDNPDRTFIFTFDSLGTDRPATIERLANYLKKEAQDKLQKSDTNDPVGMKAQVPVQPNFFDCGLYLLHFTDVFMSDPEKYSRIIRARQEKGVPVRSRSRELDWKYNPSMNLREQWRLKIDQLSAEWKKDRIAKEEAKRKEAAENPAVEVIPSSDDDIDIVSTSISTQSKTKKGGKRKPSPTKPKREGAKRLRGG
ncbi:hypothetical protein H0H93_014618 [Arthromyces matolae]|nr:hypothetical protein H0H93_014618 [Arthromyces matolae]